MARRNARSSISSSHKLTPWNSTLAKSVLYNWVNIAGTETNSTMSTNTDTNWCMKL